jgi:hypothetical protein
MWRISNDFWDTWTQLKAQFPLCAQWAHISGPKSWPDADMLPIGNLRLRGPFGKPGKSFFTEDEQYTMMTLWTIFRSPLMIGANLPDADDLLMKLLTNFEVLEVNQHSTNGREVQNENGQVIWLADIPATNDKYIAIFNLGENAKEISVVFSALGLGNKYKVRDLWEKKDLGNLENGIKATLPAHGSKLFSFESL